MLSSQTSQVNLSLGDNIYIIATTLDPQFALQWMDKGISTNEEFADNG